MAGFHHSYYVGFIIDIRICKLKAESKDLDKCFNLSVAILTSCNYYLVKTKSVLELVWLWRGFAVINSVLPELERRTKSPPEACSDGGVKVIVKGGFFSQGVNGL